MRIIAAVLAALAAMIPFDGARAQVAGEPLEQGARNCTLRVDPGGVTRREGDLLFIDDPFTVVCDDGANLRANTGTYDRQTRIVTLTGDVDFEDPTRTLTSDRAVYNSALGVLHATGSVVFVDLAEGTTLTGPDLEYYRATEERPQALVNAMGRPRLTLQRLPGRQEEDTVAAGPPPPATDPAAADTSGMPLTIDADRMTIEGRNDLTAFGNVVIQDDEMRAVADEAEQRGSSETMELRGNAEIHSREYSLAANVIFATVPEGSLREVEATGDARLLGEDLNVEAPRLDLTFAEDLLQRSVARSDPALAPGVQPLATSPTFRLQADSIDASLPGQRLELVVAIGNARGEMIDTTRASAGTPDSVSPAATDSLFDALEGEGDPGVTERFATGDSVTTVSALELIANDWITGDTITGYFTTVVREPGDSVGADAGLELEEAAAAEGADDVEPEVVAGPLDGVMADPGAPGGAAPDTALVMERMVSVGAARSLYHVAPQADAPPGTRSGINFLSAARIELTFADGRVEVADVTGLRRGLYLEPVDPDEEEAVEDEAGVAEGEEGEAEGVDAGEEAGEAEAPVEPAADEPAPDDGPVDVPPDAPAGAPLPDAPGQNQGATDGGDR